MRQWRTADLLTTAEAAFLTRMGLAPATLEVCCQPGQASFSVVEETREGFRWATYNPRGRCHDHGLEDTRQHARQVAREAQRLWCHRCATAGTPACPGFCLNTAQAETDRADRPPAIGLAKPGSLKNRGLAGAADAPRESA